MRASALLFGVAISAASAAAQANLLVDGGFESPTVPTGNFTDFTGGAVIGGAWTVTGHDVLVINKTYAEGPLVFNSHTGSQALDITGAGNTGFSDGLSQTVSVAAGSYNLTFWVGNAQDSPDSNRYNLPSSLGLYVNSAFVGNYTNNNITTNQVNWEEFVVPLTFSTSGNETIAFENATGNGESAPPSPPSDNYAGLDDVSLNPVPEPASLLLLGAAVIGFGMLRNRTRDRHPVSPIS